MSKLEKILMAIGITFWSFFIGKWVYNKISFNRACAELSDRLGFGISDGQCNWVLYGEHLESNVNIVMPLILIILIGVSLTFIWMTFPSMTLGGLRDCGKSIKEIYEEEKNRK